MIEKNTNIKLITLFSVIIVSQQKYRYSVSLEF